MQYISEITKIGEYEVYNTADASTTYYKKEEIQDLFSQGIKIIGVSLVGTDIKIITIKDVIKKYQAMQKLLKGNIINIKIVDGQIILHTPLEAIPDFVTSLGNSFHFLNKDMEQVEIRSGISRLGIKMFKGFKKLKSVQLSEEIGVLPDNTFDGCISLESVNIPNFTRAIGNHCFHNCINLKELTFPTSLSQIGERAFAGCKSIREIVILGKEEKTDTRVWYRIDEAAFGWCTSLVKVILPTDIKRLPNGLFYGCSALKEIKIPDRVEEIGVAVFKECTALEEIIIPDSVTSIEKSVFADCSSLSDVYITKQLLDKVIREDYIDYYIGDMSIYNSCYQDRKKEAMKRSNELITSDHIKDGIKRLGIDSSKVSVHIR